MGSALVSASMRRVERGKASTAAPGSLGLGTPAATPPQARARSSHWREPPAPSAKRLLDGDLTLQAGSESITLFPSGAFSEFSFFQRQVDADHELEHVVYPAESGRGFERIRLIGLSEPILKLEQQTDLWERLREDWDLERLPDVRSIMTHAPTSHDPRTEGSGRNAVPISDGHYRVDGQRPISFAQALEVLRLACRPRQLIAWIEAGIADLQVRSVILHRYYIDAGQNVYVVRQHGRTRQLFLPRPCPPPTVFGPSRTGRAQRVPEWPPRRGG